MRLSDKPVVSGAMNWETVPPIRQIAAAINMQGPIPMVEMPTGRRNVPLAAPMRLKAVEKPIPVLRSSVGNTSAG